jgi:hypothetical protein
VTKELVMNAKRRVLMLSTVLFLVAAAARADARWDCLQRVAGGEFNDMTSVAAATLCAGARTGADVAFKVDCARRAARGDFRHTVSYAAGTLCSRVTTAADVEERLKCADTASGGQFNPIGSKAAAEVCKGQ